MNSNDHQTTVEHPLQDGLKVYIRLWYWFVIGCLITLTGGYLFLRYATPVYEVKAKVIIKDERNSSGFLELSAIPEIGNFMSRYGNSKIEDEIAIFTSKRLITNVIKELKLNTVYRAVGNVKTSELYGNLPFTVQFLDSGKELKGKPMPVLNIEIQDEETFVISTDDSERATHKFGDRIQFDFASIIVLPNLEDVEIFNKYKQETVTVTYTDEESLALHYQNNLTLLNEVLNSHVIELSYSTPIPEKGKDFINELIDEYNNDAVNDRNQITRRTLKFVDSRLDIITKELDSVELDKEEFKSTNRLTDIQTEAGIILESASEFEKQQLSVTTQLELINTMIDYMETENENELLPSNIGLQSEDVVVNVNDYNQLLLERNRLLKSSTTKNPVIVTLNNQIDQLRASILQSLKNSRNGYRVSLKDLNYGESRLNRKIQEVPAKERIYRDIERQQSIKEQLFLFLLQQREESLISLAANATKAKIVDSGYSSQEPVSPNRLMIYFITLVLGLLLPFTIIYLTSIFNNKIPNREELEKLLGSIGILGEIPKISKNTQDFVGPNDRSILAESFRILRTNIQYYRRNTGVKTDQGFTMFVTSSITNEGKTFVAYNLATTLALTGKKVVLVGADIRNPQLHRYLADRDKSFQGLTEYIADESVTLDSIIAKSDNLDSLNIILSGAIPPNPAELLMRERAVQFFNELKSKFDYVIVDTAPSMVVTDTLLISSIADMTLYVVRADYTEKRLVGFVTEASRENKLKNIGVVLNGVSENNFGYGNKYGYVYGQEKKPWHKRIFN
ncbi:polysaccharide biosynthesis tyrosine autokinase [Aureitalea sp. L0-47]|uniref:GumC family protein n=1 Tax=Aureitalea sp. L0-47 TaxID=2816962 RepID=UPI002238BE49|nr:tyrosine-protein kinase [Aureitalea sp. L0-47]MCW5520383.1 polysaccharide biosynthesis tyrosine autokinase [Aureitalea sp. L0-47]